MSLDEHIKIQIEKQKKYILQYNLIDFTKYAFNFEIQIQIRGDKIYKDNRIEDYIYEKNTASCKIKGTELYNVSIKFDKDDNIIQTKCNCPYSKKGNNCKHMYALLIKAKLEDNYDKLIDIMNKKFEEYKTIYGRCYSYFNKNIKKYSGYDIERINDFISYYQDNRIKRFETITSHELNQTGYLNVIMELQEGKKIMIDDFQDIRDNEDEMNQVNYIKNSNSSNNSYNNRKKDISDVIYKNRKKIYFGAFLSGLFKGLTTPTQEQKRKAELEKEMDYQGLYDWQKDLVRKGIYDPTSFDEENPEEDDYYYGDD